MANACTHVDHVPGRRCTRGHPGGDCQTCSSSSHPVLRSVEWRTGDVDRVGAWRLIFHATSDRALADDWCDDLAGALARLPAEGGGLDREQLMTWLHAAPAPDHVRGAVARAA